MIKPILYDSYHAATTPTPSN